ncbi:VPLPA-CTERM sorting domain-containing protein [Tropicibacter sp. S64]|uniref:VPLPA-CTERM sorting domain-containing protein n=1 Tax=Tropicibacter sp. S64 TaxID=3415122 RepID=UPI003C7B3D7D
MRFAKAARTTLLALVVSTVSAVSAQAVVVHQYSGTSDSDPLVTLSGWFTISESTVLESGVYLANSDILDLSFVHSEDGTAGMAGLVTADRTSLSAVDGTVTGGQGGFLSILAPYNAPFQMTLYGGGLVRSTGGFYSGTWTSYIGAPPNASAVPLPAGFLLLSTALGLAGVLSRRRRT